MLCCGELEIELLPIGISEEPFAKKTKWKYSVFLNGKLLCDGKELFTPINKNEIEAAQELVGFLVESEEESRKEFGWNFTSEEIYDVIEIGESDTENEYLITKK